MKERAESIWEEMVDFVIYKIIPKCPLQSFTVDVYRKIDAKFWIFGFNPFSPPTNSFYFSWEELFEEKFGEYKPEFRYNDGQS